MPLNEQRALIIESFNGIEIVVWLNKFIPLVISKNPIIKDFSIGKLLNKIWE